MMHSSSFVLGDEGIYHLPSGSLVSRKVLGTFIIYDKINNSKKLIFKSYRSAIKKLEEIQSQFSWRVLGTEYILDGWNDWLSIKKINNRFWPHRCDAELIDEDGNFVSFASFDAAAAEAVKHRYSIPPNSSYMWLDENTDQICHDYEALDPDPLQP